MTPMSAPVRPLSPAEAEARLLIPAIAPDDSLYPMGKLEAHRRGLFHLAVSVFVFAGPAMLIQQRALAKYHSGGQWANTCCTHPHWGEAPAAAAARRLREELSLVLPLRWVRVAEYRADVGGGLIEHERVHMFCAQAPRDLVIRPDPDEVMATRWVEPEALAADLALHPDRYTPWFRIYCERYPDEGALRHAP